MTRVIEIEKLLPIDQTAIDVLREISLALGDKNEAYVPYSNIATKLKISRKKVASAVSRMVERGILNEKNGKLSIPLSKLANV